MAKFDAGDEATWSTPLNLEDQLARAQGIADSFNAQREAQHEQLRQATESVRQAKREQDEREREAIELQRQHGKREQDRDERDAQRATVEADQRKTERRRWMVATGLALLAIAIALVSLLHSFGAF